MKQELYWNNVAYKKEFTTPFHFEAFEKVVGKDAFILDVGCGYGRTLQQLYKHGYDNLVGIDFSKKMIERGKNQYPYLDLRVKNKKEIEFENNSCDAVILFAVLTCIIDDKEQLDLIKEIKRVLKPNGVIYINDFLLNSDERNLKRYKEFENKYRKYGVFELSEGAVVRHHNIKWIKELCDFFEYIALEQVTYTTMNGNRSNGFYFLGRK
ncbi:class I SAM-dependent methyltransferase [Clostridium scatologenes]|uniref:Methyltransferase type 11 n=1 Tax=Clostridium scatologenes TaxID=1548 RepID=A0A0E3JN49_CLOSL|nr:class I SAM-dependent methyltransferase [Clostridium scatologenes]AKA68854.1 Methyltransferase type 11 [Clostridium scatologenes]